MPFLRPLTLLLFLGLWHSAAEAHALVLNAKPGANTVVEGDEVEVEIRFNSRIDVERSHLKLFTPSGEAMKLTTTGGADTLRATVRGLEPGDYRLHWQTLSPDGHISQGDIPFGVRR